MTILESDYSTEGVEPGIFNVFPTQILCKLTNLKEVDLEGQLLRGSASALWHLSQLHTLKL